MGDFGGMLQADWTPVNLNNSGGPLGIRRRPTHAHVFRILADFAFQHHFSSTLSSAARAGIGVDIAHAAGADRSWARRARASDTDAGLAVEFGGGVFYDFGGTQVGGEIALPIGNHNSASENGSIAFQYASEDIDLLAAVRLRGF